MSDIQQTKIVASYHRDRTLLLTPQEGQTYFGLAVHFKNAQGEDQIVAQMEKPVEVIRTGVIQMVEQVFTKMQWAEGHPIKDLLTPYILQVSDLQGEKIVGTKYLDPVVFDRDGSPHVKDGEPKPAPAPQPKPQPTPNGDKPGDKPATPPPDEIKEITDRLNHVNDKCVMHEDEIKKEIRPDYNSLLSMTHTLDRTRPQLARLKAEFPTDASIAKLYERFNKTSTRAQALAEERNRMVPLDQAAEIRKRLDKLEEQMKNLKPGELSKLRDDVSKLQSELGAMAKTADVQRLEQRLNTLDTTLGKIDKASQKFSTDIDRKFGELSEQIRSLGSAGSSDKKGRDEREVDEDTKRRDREDRRREERRDERHDVREVHHYSSESKLVYMIAILVLLILGCGFFYLLHVHPAAVPIPVAVPAPASQTVIEMPPMPNAGIIYQMAPAPAPTNPPPPPAPRATTNVTVIEHRYERSLADQSWRPYDQQWYNPATAPALPPVPSTRKTVQFNLPVVLGFNGDCYSGYNYGWCGGGYHGGYGYRGYGGSCGPWTGTPIGTCYGYTFANANGGGWSGGFRGGGRRG